MNRKSENLWTSIAIIIFFGLLVFSYVYKSILKTDATVIASYDDACNLRTGTCTVELPEGGKVHFTMSPNSIPLLKPIALDVKIEGVDATNVMVDFEGIGMDMGSNQSALSKTKSNHFLGTTILPACSHQKMEWQANVQLTTKQGVISAPFRFYTVRKN